MPIKKRFFSLKRKVELLRQYDALPSEGRTGERKAFQDKHNFSWSTLNRWRNQAAVKKMLGEEVVEPELSKNGSGRRKWTMKEKAQILAQYEALPYGSSERPAFLAKNRVYFNMIKLWKAQLEGRTSVRVERIEQPKKTELTAKELIDILELEHEGLGSLIERMKGHVK